MVTVLAARSRRHRSTRLHCSPAVGARRRLLLQDEGSTTGSISPTRRIYPAQVYMAGPSAPVYPMEVTLQDKVTKLTITRELAIRAQKHVDDGTFPAPEDPQEDRQAVQYLLWREAGLFAHTIFYN